MGQQWRGLYLSSGSLYLIPGSGLGGKPDLLGLGLLRDSLFLALEGSVSPPGPAHCPPHKSQSVGGSGASWLSDTQPRRWNVHTGHPHTQSAPQMRGAGQILEGCWKRVCL